MNKLLTKISLGATLSAGALLALTATSHAGIAFDNSDLLDGETVGSYFSGAKDANGNAGPNLGAVFGGGAVNQVSILNGGSSPFTGIPAGSQNAYFFSSIGSDVVDIAGGFKGNVSAFFSSITGGEIDVWSGLDATGTELAKVTFGANDDPDACANANPSISFCSWTSVTAAFSGTAKSIDFSNAGVTAFGDLAVPEPASLALFATGFAAFGFYRRQNRA